MNRSAPTEAEASALRRMGVLRSQVFAVVLTGATVPLLARIIPNAWVQVVVATCAVAAVIGAALYLSFGLRCPRCSSWVPPAPTARSRCTSCGMSLRSPDEKNSRAAPRQ
jgi:hypothetical protein